MQELIYVLLFFALVYYIISIYVCIETYTAETMFAVIEMCVCVCTRMCMHVCVGELQLAGSIGQYLLNRNQIFWIMPYPQKDLLVSIIQHICAFC